MRWKRRGIPDRREEDETRQGKGRLREKGAQMDRGTETPSVRGKERTGGGGHIHLDVVEKAAELWRLVAAAIAVAIASCKLYRRHLGLLGAPEAPLCKLLELVSAPGQIPHKVAIESRLLTGPSKIKGSGG